MNNRAFPESFEFVFGKHVEYVNKTDANGEVKLSEKEVVYTSNNKNQLEQFLLPYDANILKFSQAFKFLAFNYIQKCWLN
ncbi:hypothetical protein [Mycoplasmopsis bovis]|uniref:hypothetical protein n=1 Tax=Mycoplasmopsis bovis TaxID=28903 RepID=UPI003D2A178F